jgi:hypothetical protein
MLYLGYDNGPSDGGGAQLHRIMNLYCICRAFHFQYVHYPITFIDNKGIHYLENNIKDDESFEAAFNSFLQLNEHVILPASLPADIREVKIGELAMEHILKYAPQAKIENILLRTTLSRPIIERCPDLYRFAPELRPPPPPRYTPSIPLLVDIHIRRGDLLVADSWRMLPNNYYVSIITLLNQIIPRFTSNYIINVHTEAPTKETVIHPDNYVITNRITKDVTIRPEDLHLEDFSLPHVRLCINESPTEALEAFTRSHIFVMSHSSFSVIGAAMNRNGIILYHPFWHRPAPYWLNTQEPTLPNQLDAKLRALFTAE